MWKNVGRRPNFIMTGETQIKKETATNNRREAAIFLRATKKFFFLSGQTLTPPPS